jgi:catalase-peroxidase
LVDDQVEPGGCFDRRVARGELSNDFFVNLLDMKTEWKAASATESTFEGRDRKHGELRWTGARST